MEEPQNILRRKRPYREIKCSADVLKWLGFVCVCLGSFSTAVVQRGIIDLDAFSTQTLYDAMKPGGGLMAWASLAVAAMLLSALAIPLYAKLLYEGWLHTANQMRYLGKLLLLALISECPYDWAFSGQLMDMSRQNPVWALAVAVVMLSIFRQYGIPGIGGWLLKAAVLLAAVAWTVVLQSDMGMITVLLAAVFYFFAEKKSAQLLLGILICAIQFPAPFGMAFVHWYDGTRGKTPRLLFYILYPLQLLVFGLIASLV